MEFCRKYFTELFRLLPHLRNALIKSGISQAPAQQPIPEISAKTICQAKLSAVTRSQIRVKAAGNRAARIEGSSRAAKRRASLAKVAVMVSPSRKPRAQENRCLYVSHEDED